MSMAAARRAGTAATDASSSTVSRRFINLTVHGSVLSKVQLLLAAVVAGSCLQAVGVVPSSSSAAASAFFSSKTNPVNRYMAKFSWMWTLMWMVASISLPLFLLPLRTRTNFLPLRDLLRHFGRAAVGHAVWYGVTTLIVVVENLSGDCSDETIATARACLRGGHAWSGYDISGHVFLLSYCVFVITEEAANVRAEDYWHTNEASERLAASEREREAQSERVCRNTQYFAEALELFALLLVLVWSTMLVVTSLYFHTLWEKLAGFGLAVLAWYLTYGVLYGSSRYLPCRPSCGGMVLQPSEK